MAIRPLVRAVLRALSYPDIELKEHYRLIRWFHSLTLPNIGKPMHRIWNHRIPAGGHDISVRLYDPKGKGGHPLLVFFHGGGWVTGTIDSYDKVCRTMAAQTGHIVASVDYRLAPEHRFPAAVEDCYLVTKEIFDSCHLLGVAPSQITLVGDSAGGNLAAAISLMARDRGDFFPERQILFYPACASDHTPRAPYPSIRENGQDYLLTSKRVQDYMEMYAASPEDFKNPYFAPLEAKDLSRQPDTLIFTAEFDPLRDEGEAYGHALRAAGNRARIQRIEGSFHGFLSLGEHFSHVKQCYTIVRAFLREDKGHIP